MTTFFKWLLFSTVANIRCYFTFSMFCIFSYVIINLFDVSIYKTVTLQEMKRVVGCLKFRVFNCHMNIEE